MIPSTSFGAFSVDSVGAAAGARPAASPRPASTIQTTGRSLVTTAPPSPVAATGTGQVARRGSLLDISA